MSQQAHPSLVPLLPQLWPPPAGCATPCSGQPLVPCHGHSQPVPPQNNGGQLLRPLARRRSAASSFPFSAPTSRAERLLPPSPVRSTSPVVSDLGSPSPLLPCSCGPSASAASSHCPPRRRRASGAVLHSAGPLSDGTLAGSSQGTCSCWHSICTTPRSRTPALWSLLGTPTSLPLVH